MNQMSFDEVIDQTRPPMVKSDIIDKFLGQIVDLARHSDFKDYGFNSIRWMVILGSFHALYFLLKNGKRCDENGERMSRKW